MRGGPCCGEGHGNARLDFFEDFGELGHAARHLVDRPLALLGHLLGHHELQRLRRVEPRVHLPLRRLVVEEAAAAAAARAGAAAAAELQIGPEVLNLLALELLEEIVVPSPELVRQVLQLLRALALNVPPHRLLQKRGQ